MRSVCSLLSMVACIACGLMAVSPQSHALDVDEIFKDAEVASKAGDLTRARLQFDR
jgi:hypothetical protein